jgi:hypothetical protein
MEREKEREKVRERKRERERERVRKIEIASEKKRDMLNMVALFF